MHFVSVRLFAKLFGVALLAFANGAEAREFRPLYQFAGGTDGDGSVDRLLLDNAGNLYGVTTANKDVLGTVFMLSPGGTETVLHAFQYVTGHPSIPVGGVVMDAAGNLYGEAVNGGAVTCPEINPPNPDCGSVYKLATDGTVTTMHSFQGGEDGSGPTGGLLIDGTGNLYGTTKFGGLPATCGNVGCGTVFKIAPNGTKTVLYNFAGNSDGGRPTGALIADAQSNLYGTTTLGGQGYGTIFKLAPNGSETQLYAFNGLDGNQPSSGLVLDISGNLYGTTAASGNLNNPYGEVFRLSPGGVLTVLHAFGAGKDGAYPTGGLAIDALGNVFGTATQGGKGCRSFGCGTIFKIAKNGTYSQIYLFKGHIAHDPLGGLVTDGNGTVFGSALGPYGDPNPLGLIFAVQK